MTANAAGFNPLPMTNALGSFPSPDTDGYIVGTFMDDPAIRNELANGVLANTETLPIWGGVGIYENIPSPPTPFVSELGGQVGRATSVTASAAASLTGFSVFNQAYAWVTSPQSTVPTGGSGMTVPLFRLGSGARIVVACDAALVSIEGDIITQQVSWDFIGQQLVPYVAPYVAATPSVYNSYTSATGILQLTFGSAPGPIAGDYIALAGFTGAQAVFNGSWPILSTASAGTVLNIQVTAGLGTISMSGAAGTLVAGGGALACKVLHIKASNCMGISYNPTTNMANWNRNVAAALIQI